MSFPTPRTYEVTPTINPNPYGARTSLSKDQLGAMIYNPGINYRYPARPPGYRQPIYQANIPGGTISYSQKSLQRAQMKKLKSMLPAIQALEIPELVKNGLALMAEGQTIQQDMFQGMMKALGNQSPDWLALLTAIEDRNLILAQRLSASLTPKNPSLGYLMMSPIVMTEPKIELMETPTLPSSMGVGLNVGNIPQGSVAGSVAGSSGSGSGDPPAIGSGSLPTFKPAPSSVLSNSLVNRVYDTATINAIGPRNGMVRFSLTNTNGNLNLFPLIYENGTWRGVKDTEEANLRAKFQLPAIQVDGSGFLFLPISKSDLPLLYPLWGAGRLSSNDPVLAQQAQDALIDYNASLSGQTP